MELNSIINDDKISASVKEMYKFIEKNEDKINDIFNRSYKDIKNLFSDVSFNSNSIEITNLETKNIDNDRIRCVSVLTNHARDILHDDKYLISYFFRINTTKTSIIITKKH